MTTSTRDHSGAEDDRAWVRAAVAGDDRACRAIVDAHGGAMFALVDRMLSPAGLAPRVEDIVQEAFLRAFGALPRFDVEGPARLRTWLLVIATRLSLNECRRRQPVVADDLEDRLVAPFSADVQCREQLAARAVARSIAALSPSQRGALVLHVFHGLEEAEIADALQVPRGTVKSRIARARARLRGSLQEDLT